ncbi:hypothetical protein F7725_006844 [Dissostichus mawsoni]|uniref:Claudin n=1 Tax=Dissostichus mawsoni TaxID=36200 RepID=A0A7J5XV42_DISMA|nr:hypothetical protein F7725_006844 [Dissostichus mawsoni]
MASAGLQIFAIFLAIIGFLGDIIICALPMWKVSAFIGSNIITAQTYWEGLWMNCVKQSTGQMQCKVYDSMLALPLDLQAARALVVISILVALMGIMLAVAGGKCTNCIEDEEAKSKVAIAAGVFFIVSSMLCIIPVSWSANTVIRNFYNPIMNDAQRGSWERCSSVGSIRTYADWRCTSLLQVPKEGQRILSQILCSTLQPVEEPTFEYTFSRKLE